MNIVPNLATYLPVDPSDVSARADASAPVGVPAVHQPGGSVESAPASPATLKILSALERIFGPKEQVKLAPPPEAPPNDSALDSLTQKFKNLFKPRDPGAGTKVPTNPTNTNSPKDFDITMLLELVLRVAQDAFKNSSLQAQVDLDKKVNYLKSSADEQDKSATARFDGSLISGIGQVVGGAVSMGGAAVSGVGAFKANQAVSSISDAATKSSEFNRLSTLSSNFSSAGQSSGSVISSGLGIGGSDYDMKSTDDDADKARKDAGAAIMDTAHDTAANQSKQEEALIQDFLDRQKGMEQSRDQASMAIGRII